MTRDIRDFFHINLDSLPHNDFSQLNTGKNEEVNRINIFQKKLTTPIFNLFKIIEVEILEFGQKNIYFRNYEIDKIEIKDLRALITLLYTFYGKDDTGKSAFNAKDKFQFLSILHSHKFGREWSIGDKIETPVTLFLNREKKIFSLGILGLNHI